MNRRDILKASLLASVGWSYASVSYAQITNVNDAINKAGRQRMLSQRMAKAYLQIGMNVDLESSKKILDTSLALFDRQLIELKNFSTSADIKSAVLNIDKTWIAYKDLLLGKAPNVADAKQILRFSDVLLEMTDHVTQQLEKYANSKTGGLVNISGRQRMLSQRVAKMYQAIQWEVASSDTASALEAARKEFNNNMRSLEANPNNTKAIQTELTFAQQQWLFFDHAIRQAPDPRMRQQYATTVATTSERILQQMDIVTSQYEKLS